MSDDEIKDVLGHTPVLHRWRSPETSRIGLKYDFPDGSVSVYLKPSPRRSGCYEFDGVGGFVRIETQQSDIATDKADAEGRRNSGHSKIKNSD
jgi:hypothetical protein